MRQAQRFRLVPAGSSAVPQPDWATSTPFLVDIAPEREAVRLCPVGELDIATVDGVRDHLDELLGVGFKRVILDLRGATFLDSTGLRLIVAAHASSARDGWQLVIFPGPHAVQRVFDLAGMTARLPFVDPLPGLNGSRWL